MIARDHINHVVYDGLWIEIYFCNKMCWITKKPDQGSYEYKYETTWRFIRDDFTLVSPAGMITTVTEEDEQKINQVLLRYSKLKAFI